MPDKKETKLITRDVPTQDRIVKMERVDPWPDPPPDNKPEPQTPSSGKEEKRHDSDKK